MQVFEQFFLVLWFVYNEVTYNEIHKLKKLSKMFNRTECVIEQHQKLALTQNQTTKFNQLKFVQIPDNLFESRYKEEY